MKKVSMATRRELVEAVGERHRAADRASKGKVLDEFVAVTGLHRKHAMRILRQKATPSLQTMRSERRIYTEAVRTALIVLWEASDRLCGKRLRSLVPIPIEAMEGHGHLALDQVIKTKLLQMSAATIDRALQSARANGSKPRRRGVPVSELRRSIPIRTFSDWGDPAPGIHTLRAAGIMRRVLGRRFGPRRANSMATIRAGAIVGCCWSWRGHRRARLADLHLSIWQCR